jgi:hypothetical protein
MREFSKLNKTQQVIVNAHNIGYYSKDGKCYNPKGEELKSHLKRKNHRNTPYHYIHLPCEGPRFTIRLHQFIAYQLYDMQYFQPGIVARHKDGNSLNNSLDNIIIGTHTDNTADMTKESRRNRSLQAMKTKRRLKNGLDRMIWNDHRNRLSSEMIAFKYDIVPSTVRNQIKKISNDPELLKLMSIPEKRIQMELDFTS